MNSFERISEKIDVMFASMVLFVEGYSHTEIGKMLNVSISYVSRLIKSLTDEGVIVCTREIDELKMPEQYRLDKFAMCRDKLKNYKVADVAIFFVAGDPMKDIADVLNLSISHISRLIRHLIDEGIIVYTHEIDESKIPPACLARFIETKEMYTQGIELPRSITTDREDLR